MNYVIRTTSDGVIYAKYSIDREPQPEEKAISSAMYQQVEVPCRLLGNEDGSVTVIAVEPPVVQAEVYPTYPEITGPTYTELELAQQAITDLELADIEQGQAITDLEIMILEGQRHV